MVPGLTSLLLEELKDLPGAVVDEVSAPTLTATMAALIAGEPRRALAILEAAGPEVAETAEASVLRHLALSRDRNWCPGGTGCPELEGVAELGAFRAPVLADPVATLVARVLVDLQACLPALRTLARGSTRVLLPAGLHEHGMAALGGDDSAASTVTSSGSSVVGGASAPACW